MSIVMRVKANLDISGVRFNPIFVVDLFTSLTPPNFCFILLLVMVSLDFTLLKNQWQFIFSLLLKFRPNLILFMAIFCISNNLCGIELCLFMFNFARSVKHRICWVLCRITWPLSLHLWLNPFTDYRLNLLGTVPKKVRHFSSLDIFSFCILILTL